MKEIKLIKVIYCSKSTRGSGENKISPVRRIIEIFDKKGNNIAENDPCSFTIETIKEFIEYRFKGEEREKIKEWAQDYFTSD